MRAVHHAVRARCIGFPRARTTFSFPLCCFLHLTTICPSLVVRNVRYEPYGPWDHFPSGIFGQPKATRRRGSDSDSNSDSDSDSSSSGSSLTSADEEEEEASS